MAGSERGSAVLDLAAAQQGLDAQPFSRLVQARITEFGTVLPLNGPSAEGAR
ncbi:hypothetical protein [Streptomyces sp. BP-8]|uniref:Uncharacterized protein n=1 Tax=Streptomyces sirii TaxID=3127701 RepID=A0ABZ2QUT9_9ACTN